MKCSIGIAAVVLAIVVTTTMDATGLTVFSALPLFPIAALLWYVTGVSRRQVGLTWGSARPYVIALAYPIVVIGLCAVASLGTSATDRTRFDGTKTLANIAIGTVATTIAVVLTEEGFFRGALWASIEQAVAPRMTLALTTLAFALWHVSAVTLPTGFDLPAARVPVVLINAAIMGGIWGVIRRMSGSVLASSVSHGLWNGLAYALFGYGTKTGALGVANGAVFGPEVGILGLALNVGALMIFLTVFEPSVVKTLNNPERNPDERHFSDWRDDEGPPSEVSRAQRQTSRRVR